MGAMILLITLASCGGMVQSSQEGIATMHHANPIRKVVTMLHMMQKKVTEEGALEKELFEKFMCYCKNGGKDLSASINAAETKIPDLESGIEAATGKKTQLEEKLKQEKTDRDGAKVAISEANKIREKEATAFAAVDADDKANIAAIAKAIAALEKGVAGSFLQTNAADALRKMIAAKKDLDDDDKQGLLSFLSSSHSEEYAPRSGEIIGILKQMHDEMINNLQEATEAEEQAIKEHADLIDAKKKELAALTRAIETKLAQVGELSVQIAQMKNDLEDTEEALAADKKFLSQLDTDCATKSKEHEANKKMRAEELVALAETIKILNDDDALELFKKTLPSSSSSFIQLQVTSAEMRSRALALLRVAKRRVPLHRPRLDFIAMALHGSKIGFEKVSAMIDDMIKTLKMEQADDDKKKAYCEKEFDDAEDKRKHLERSIGDEGTVIANTKESIATSTDEIAALTKKLAELDSMVAQATQLRKAEHSAFEELIASDTAAKDVLSFAKNRLNKFYNPKLYVAPPKRELSEEDSIVTSMGGTLAPTQPPAGIAGTGISVAFAQVTAQVNHKAAPPPPPETASVYTSKSSESTGVIAMIDLLIKDLDKEMTVAKTEEADAQTDYEVLMKDSSNTRAADSKSLELKKSINADLEADLQEHKDAKTALTAEMTAHVQYIKSLHAECDWLLKFFDVRKEARESEIDALGKAQDVLSGADYSLIQTRSHSFLGRLA